MNLTSKRSRAAAVPATFLLSFALQGCSRAPMVDIFGSFLPTWIFCIAGGILLTLVVRFVLVRTGLDTELGPRIIVYPSMVTLFACVIWLFLPA